MEQGVKSVDALLEILIMLSMGDVVYAGRGGSIRLALGGRKRRVEQVISKDIPLALSGLELQLLDGEGQDRGRLQVKADGSWKLEVTRTHDTPGLRIP
jgi:hypothetical protein